MTRINSNIKPIALTDAHLIAEIKEINQLIGGYKRSKESKKGIILNKIPFKFTLNSGHCYFFYNKFKFLFKRFILLKQEGLNRGFNIQCEFNFSPIKNEHYNDYIPSELDSEIVKKRIIHQLSNQKMPIRYYSQVINLEQAILILNS